MSGIILINSNLNKDVMVNSIFCLKCVRVMQDLTDDEIREISNSVEEASYRAGEVIYVPEQSQGKIYFVREGEVDIYQKSISGKTFVVSTLQAGDIFGDLDLSSEHKMNVNFAKAVKPTKVCIVDKVSFMVYLQKKPQVAMRIIEELSKRLNEAEEKIRDLAFNEVKIRLLNELWRLAMKFGRKESDGYLVIEKKLTHQDLANRISASRETVTKAMGELEEKGFIAYNNNRLIVLNINKINITL